MFSFGFYNSLNGDRKYDALQISQIFDGIIEDGVYSNIGEIFATVPGTGMSVIVKSGRAWFDHTWSLNDSHMPLTIEESDFLQTRIDAVVLEVDSRTEKRENSIKIVKGQPSVNPVKPALLHDGGVGQHALAYVTVGPNVTEITGGDIEIVVGKDETPFVQCPLKTVSISDLYQQWDAEFTEWFDNIKLQLTDDVVANLQRQIDEKVNVDDKATEQDISNRDPNKWVSAEGLVQAGANLAFYQIGDIVKSTRNLEKETNGKWVACDQRVWARGEIPDQIFEEYKYRLDWNFQKFSTDVDTLMPIDIGSGAYSQFVNGGVIPIIDFMLPSGIYVYKMVRSGTSNVNGLTIIDRRDPENVRKYETIMEYDSLKFVACIENYIFAFYQAITKTGSSSYSPSYPYVIRVNLNTMAEDSRVNLSSIFTNGGKNGGITFKALYYDYATKRMMVQASYVSQHGYSPYGYYVIISDDLFKTTPTKYYNCGPLNNSGNYGPKGSYANENGIFSSNGKAFSNIQKVDNTLYVLFINDSVDNYKYAAILYSTDGGNTWANSVYKISDEPVGNCKYYVDDNHQLVELKSFEYPNLNINKYNIKTGKLLSSTSIQCEPDAENKYGIGTIRDFTNAQYSGNVLTDYSVVNPGIQYIKDNIYTIGSIGIKNNSIGTLEYKGIVYFNTKLMKMYLGFVVPFSLAANNQLSGMTIYNGMAVFKTETNNVSTGSSSSTPVTRTDSYSFEKYQTQNLPYASIEWKKELGVLDVENDDHILPYIPSSMYRSIRRKDNILVESNDDRIFYEIKFNKIRAPYIKNGYIKISD